jgi:hypothetical protein
MQTKVMQPLGKKAHSTEAAQIYIGFESVVLYPIFFWITVSIRNASTILKIGLINAPYLEYRPLKASLMM